MVDLTKLDIRFSVLSEMLALLGTNDKHLKILGEIYHVDIYVVGNEIMVSTKDATIIVTLTRIFQLLKMFVSRNINFNERDIIYISGLIDLVDDDKISDLFVNRKEIIKTFAGKPVYAKTINQKRYINAINKSTVVLAIGPAGTGKTYLGVLLGIAKLREGSAKRLILTRPAIEAGENLGFLPGDLQEKLDPYLRPLYDALYDILGHKVTEQMIDAGTIEIAPLAYMRGRTLENAFVILDEAQNTTSNQMKMFLTRLGFGSKMIVTGDITQTDLPKHLEPGLVIASRILKDIPDIEIIEFEKIDVVRHPLVQTILTRFENA
ncbi:MAG: PhoH family protein [Candidatus Izemoplasmatales bacterium]|jgi:phosphate starvation-inducible PhoH-like protein|nr:PhoH family protein [Candidatus Izemoplasmatales bacterium]MDD4596223.1 PhoH family protein [Candidatus Izemoplasmatales bacterium]